MIPNVVVIGGSSGIGLQIVKSMISEAQIFVLSRNRGPLKDYEQVHWYSFDVTTDTPLPEALPQEIHALVYCPGSITLKPLRSLRPEEVLADFQLNTLGALRIIQAMLPRLKASAKASIVLFSSVAVQQGMPYHTSVGISKGALEGMVRSLAAELAPTIRVNAIAPSLSDTPLASRFFATPEKKEAAAQRHPLKRVGEPEDIAAMAVFLLSDQAAWISGQIIAVDGGMSRIRS